MIVGPFPAKNFTSVLDSESDINELARHSSASGMIAKTHFPGYLLLASGKYDEKRVRNKPTNLSRLRCLPTSRRNLSGQHQAITHVILSDEKSFHGKIQHNGLSPRYNECILGGVDLILECCSGVVTGCFRCASGNQSKLASAPE